MLVCVDTIYADSLLALNLAADYLLLLAAGRISGAVLRRRRILLASVAGAAYALASVVPEWGFLTAPILKISVGVGMALLAYGSERRFWRCCASFFAMSALFGGAVWGASLLAGTDAAGAVYVPVSLRVLVLSFAVCYAVVSLLLRGSFSKRAKRVAALELELAGRALSLRALLDTGSSLADPVTGRAVIVAGRTAAAGLLGLPSLPRDAVSAAELLASLPWLAGRVSLVPYSAVGTDSGLLAAFRPDSVRLDGSKLDALIALGDINSPDYDAIAPAGLQ